MGDPKRGLPPDEELFAVRAGEKGKRREGRVTSAKERESKKESWGAGIKPSTAEALEELDEQKERRVKIFPDGLDERSLQKIVGSYINVPNLKLFLGDRFEDVLIHLSGQSTDLEHIKGAIAHEVLEVEKDPLFEGSRAPYPGEGEPPEYAKEEAWSESDEEETERILRHHGIIK